MRLRAGYILSGGLQISIQQNGRHSALKGFVQPLATLCRYAASQGFLRAASALQSGRLQALNLSTALSLTDLIQTNPYLIGRTCYR